MFNHVHLNGLLSFFHGPWIQYNKMCFACFVKGCFAREHGILWFPGLMIVANRTYIVQPASVRTCENATVHVVSVAKLYPNGL